MDMLTVIYNALIADPYIKEQAFRRIKYYDYPATGEVNAPYIVIDPLSPPLPQVYGDNEPIADSYIYQIDVWTKDRLVTAKLSKKVSDVMRTLNFGNFAGGTDEHDKATGIFRIARRYRSVKYNEDFN